jgi:NitT/TauT family transport system permease protein
VLAFWLTVWLLIALLFDKPLLLPTPIAVTNTVWHLLLTASFWQALTLSLLRIVLGIVAALLLGTLLSFACVRVKLLDAAFAPFMNLLKSTPVASVIFLLLMFMGRNTVPLFIAFAMALPIVFANVKEGLLQTDKRLLEMAAVFGVPRGRVLHRITLPTLSPYLLTAGRTAVSLAWKAGIAAEVLAVPEHSLGRAIFESKQYLLTNELFAYTITVLLISAALEKATLYFLRDKGEKKNAKA